MTGSQSPAAMPLIVLDPAMTPRIAIVQHGDAREARRLRAAGEAEPYFGMHYSQGFLDRWLAGRPGLIVSLDAPTYREQIDDTTLIGFPEPARSGLLPRSTSQLRWAWQIAREVRRFQPTHFVLRTGTLVAAVLLRAAVRERWNTLAVFAGMFQTGKPFDRVVTGRMVKRLNHPTVAAVANHRWPATESMVDAGVEAGKVVAYDFLPTRRPEDYPFKSLPPEPVTVVYAGAMIERKGVGDVIEAVRLLRAAGRDVRLTLYGDGADEDVLRERAAPLNGAAEFRGRVGNEAVFQSMREATFVCVPSRHDFPEGFPFTLTEGLTAHTPVLASDHPVFQRVIPDGEGVRYFPAGDAAALARLLGEVADDPDGYTALSRTTTAAYERLRCPTMFHEVIERWLP